MREEEEEEEEEEEKEEEEEEEETLTWLDQEFASVIGGIPLVAGQLERGSNVLILELYSHTPLYKDNSGQPWGGVYWSSLDLLTQLTLRRWLKIALIVQVTR